MKETQIPDVHSKIADVVGIILNRYGRGHRFTRSVFYDLYVDLYPEDVEKKRLTGKHGLRGYLNGMLPHYVDKPHGHPIVKLGPEEYEVA